MNDSCKHDRATVEAELRKIVSIDDINKTLGMKLEITAKCANCGAPFHFPHFMPAAPSHPYPAVQNRDATVLGLPIKSGPAIPVLLEGPPAIPTMETVAAHN